MKRTGLLAAAALSAVIAYGCSGGGGGGAKTLTLTTPGGQITLFVTGTAGAGGQARLYKSFSPAPTPTSITIGGDKCYELGTAGGGNPTIVDADVGSKLTFTSGTISFDALKDTSSGVQYSGNTTTPGGLGADWTIRNDGGPDLAAGTIAKIHVATLLTLNGTPTVTPGSPVDLTWTGGKGADTVLVVLDGDAGQVDCYAKADGSFTVPATETAFAGSNATVFLVPMNLKLVDVNGRQVVVEAVPFNL